MMDHTGEKLFFKTYCLCDVIKGSLGKIQAMISEKQHIKKGCGY